MDIKEFIELFKALTSLVNMICNVLNTLNKSAKK